ncbi:3-oxoacyl-ACP reductase [Mycobacteroides abscessus subsp. abscessus]|nr:3-oxoacyl-ACP reductase [Mycobacteroides abscessus subsp. abscessus]
MTPTTVDAKIVAAAANAGHWAELAGGGQVTEEIFEDRVAELKMLLEPGRAVQFNSLFLDPYLWKLQLGGVSRNSKRPLPSSTSCPRSASPTSRSSPAPWRRSAP